MKITKEVYNCICAVANNETSEIGGILGSSKDGIITDVVSDIPTESRKCRFEYYPNVDFLNKSIEDWSKKGTAFLGLFHTHFNGSCDLSIVDRKYIEKIMMDCSEVDQCFYFPIYTLPDNVLNVYKAFYKNVELVILKDDLIIV